MLFLPMRHPFMSMYSILPDIGKERSLLKVWIKKKESPEAEITTWMMVDILTD